MCIHLTGIYICFFCCACLSKSLPSPVTIFLCLFHALYFIFAGAAVAAAAAYRRRGWLGFVKKFYWVTLQAKEAAPDLRKGATPTDGRNKKI